MTDWRWLVAGLIIVALIAAIMLWKRSRKPHPAPEQKVIVTVTEDMIHCKRPDGLEESVTWADLREVTVITTDEGPWVCDVFWLLVGDNGGCAIPLGSDGEKILLDRLQKLPGFDNDALIKAMGSTSNQRFLCWKKKALNAAS